MSFDVVRFGSSLYPSFMPGLLPDTETAVVTPASPISLKNVSSVPSRNAAIFPNMPDLDVCLRKYSESFSVVRRHRASMIIQSPPDFFARAAHGFHHGAATRD